MCYQLSVRPGQVASNFLYARDITSGKCIYIKIKSHLKEICALCSEEHHGDSLKVLGLMYM